MASLGSESTSCLTLAQYHAKFLYCFTSMIKLICPSQGPSALIACKLQVMRIFTKEKNRDNRLMGKLCNKPQKS